jgi:hypothetical protein
MLYKLNLVAIEQKLNNSKYYQSFVIPSFLSISPDIF